MQFNADMFNTLGPLIIGFPAMMTLWTLAYALMHWGWNERRSYWSHLKTDFLGLRELWTVFSVMSPCLLTRVFIDSWLIVYFVGMVIAVVVAIPFYIKSPVIIDSDTGSSGGTNGAMNVTFVLAALFSWIAICVMLGVKLGEMHADDQEKIYAPLQ